MKLKWGCTRDKNVEVENILEIFRFWEHEVGALILHCFEIERIMKILFYFKNNTQIYQKRHENWKPMYKEKTCRSHK